jgi:2-phosphosulfolactate phosphatase
VDIWGQDGSDIRLEWGGDGVTALGRACAVLVVVEAQRSTSSLGKVAGCDR